MEGYHLVHNLSASSEEEVLPGLAVVCAAYIHQVDKFVVDYSMVPSDRVVAGRVPEKVEAFLALVAW